MTAESLRYFERRLNRCDSLLVEELALSTKILMGMAVQVRSGTLGQAEMSRHFQQLDFEWNSMINHRC